MNNIFKEIKKPTKEQIKEFIDKNYPIQLFGRVFKNNSAVIEYYIEKLNDGFIIADPNSLEKIYKQIDEYWKDVSSHINEKYGNGKEDEIIDGLSIAQYTELCLEKNKEFIYNTAISELNPFKEEHQELHNILTSNTLNDDQKVENLKVLFNKCDEKYKLLKQ